MNRPPRLLRPFAIVLPFLAAVEASADCLHGYAACAVCAGYQATFLPAPSLAGYLYYAPVAPAAAPPAAAPAGGFLADCDGYADLPPIAENTALVNGQMFAAHIHQNLGKASVKHGMPVGVELATFMFQNATRGVAPTPREREILKRIVARYLNQRDEAAPPPSVPGPVGPTVQHGDGKSIIIVIPPGSGAIRLKIGDGPTRIIDPEPETKPDAKPEPEPEPNAKPKPEPDARPDGEVPSLTPTAHAGRPL